MSSIDPNADRARSAVLATVVEDGVPHELTVRGCDRAGRSEQLRKVIRNAGQAEALLRGVAEFNWASLEVGRASLLNFLIAPRREGAPLDDEFRAEAEVLLATLADRGWPRPILIATGDGLQTTYKLGEDRYAADGLTDGLRETIRVSVDKVRGSDAGLFDGLAIRPAFRFMLPGSTTPDVYAAGGVLPLARLLELPLAFDRVGADARICIEEDFIPAEDFLANSGLHAMAASGRN